MMEPQDTKFAVGFRYYKPSKWLAQIGLYSRFPGHVPPTYHWSEFSALAEGMAAVSKSGPWPFGTVFTIQDTGMIHVVADWHEEEADVILCYCRPEVWSPCRDRVIVSSLGILAPVPKRADLLLSALADFGKPATSVSSV